MVPFLDSDYIGKKLKYKELIIALQESFGKNEIIFPEKNYYNLSQQPQDERIIINMPSWDKRYFGVKLISVFPKNEEIWQLPQIQGFYSLMDAEKGMPLCFMDAGEITKIRTACTSALASKYLSRPNSKSLLLLGTGALAKYMVQAHCSVRPIEKVFVWGRNYKKALAICQTLILDNKIEVQAVEDYSKCITQVDIISSATSSASPLIFSNHIRKGQHLDLVGAFTPDTSEAATDVVAKCSIYVDEIKTTPKKSGEIIKALNEHKITNDHIKGDLYSLCANDIIKRKTNDEITMFKSVGLAIEDFVAAKLIWENHNINQNEKQTL